MAGEPGDVRRRPMVTDRDVAVLRWVGEQCGAVERRGFARRERLPGVCG